MSSTNTPHILILGAGLAGLTFAQGLRKQGMTYEIFERDESPESRSQGWAIALHTVYDDLKATLPDDIPSIDTTNHLLPLDLPAQATVMFDGQRMTLEDTETHHFLRANRLRLRDLLRTNVDVQWDKHIEKIEEDEESVTLFFKDGSTARGDLLIGTDGAGSSVRKHLFGDKYPLNPIPMGVINGELKLSKEQYEKQFELGRTFCCCFSNDWSIFIALNRVSEDVQSADYYWFIAWMDAEAKNEPYWTVKASQEEIHKFMREKAANKFPEEVRGILDLTKVDDIRLPPLVLRTVAVDHIPNGRITLAGDAAHAVTPFRGEGGNHAMQDAINLTGKLKGADKTNFLPLVREYEQEMLKRGVEAVKLSRCGREDEDKAVRKGVNMWQMASMSGMQDSENQGN